MVGHSISGSIFKGFSSLSGIQSIAFESPDLDNNKNMNYMSKI